MVKSLECFFFPSKLHRVIDKRNCFRFGQILLNLDRLFAVHPEKTFVPAFFKVYIEHLFDNLESEKRNYCFGRKNPKKALNFRFKNLYEPCTLDFWFKVIQSIFLFHLSMYF